VAWQKKAAAPATANLADAFLASITGDATWGWLVNWIPLMDVVTIDVAGFCAAGPPPDPGPLTPLDFFGPTRPTPIGEIANRAALILKLQQIGQARLFGAWCENPVPATTGCGPDVPPNYVESGWNTMFVPAGTNEVFVAGGHGGNVQQVFYSTTATPQTIDWSHGLAWRTVAPDIYIDNDGRATDRWMEIRVNAFRPTAYRLCGAAAHTDVYNPTPQPIPAGTIPPTTRIYNTIADLGAELDRQEFKLDVIRSFVAFLTANAALGPQYADPPVAAAAGVLIKPGAVGYRIDVTGIPAGADEMFGTPPKYHRLGRATIGSANGWLPAIDLEHNPMLIAPLPPGVDRIQVVCNAPATATITALFPGK
jgi:hypothetical protein